MKWMPGFEPENSSVYARNEIATAAPLERRHQNWIESLKRVAEIAEPS